MKSNGSKDSPWRDPMLHDKWTLKATLIILQRGARVIKSCPLQRWRSETKHDLLRSLLMGLSEDTLVQLHTTQKKSCKILSLRRSFQRSLYCVSRSDTLSRPELIIPMKIYPEVTFFVLCYNVNYDKCIFEFFKIIICIFIT